MIACIRQLIFKRERMSLSNFSLNILASWLANQLDKIMGKIWNQQEAESSEEHRQIPADNFVSTIKPRLFRSLDVARDLEEVLSHVTKPIAHIIIETEPSTFWNLVCMVIESNTSGEWYVFERGRMAVQGTGGGPRQTEIALSHLKKAEAEIVIWSSPTAILDELEAGGLLWFEVKKLLVPLFSSTVETESWDSIQMRARELLAASLSQLKKTKAE